MTVRIETTGDGGYKVIEEGVTPTGLERHLAVQAAWQGFLQTPDGQATAKQIETNRNPNRTTYP
jgi:hypothetical protein